MVEKIEGKKPRPRSKSKPTIQEELGIPDVVSPELLRKHQLEHILIKKYLLGWDITARYHSRSGISDKEQSALRRLAYSGLDFADSGNYEIQIKDLKKKISDLTLELSRLKGKMAKAETIVEKLF